MIDLRQGRYQDTLADVTCDALIVDAPYSARTHGGHDRALTASEGSAYAREMEGRRTIDYEGWEPSDVADFCDFWGPRTRGWMVTITDHALAPVWEREIEKTGRYVFAPIPWVAPGRGVRLQGDGPSSWTCWIIVGRPRTGEDRNGRPYSKWGTLPGAYVITQKPGIVVGNKPLKLMEAIVGHYSRPGDTVCDPCAGGGTTLLAASRLGRDAVGSEMDAETHHKASVRLGLRAPTADDAEWLYKRDREDKGTEGLPMFTTNTNGEA